MTAAADNLLISQPAISAQLKQLERSLGTKLFVRQPRGIKLTPAGTLLADYARRIFALAADASAAVRDLQSLRRGSLRVGASPTIGVYFLPPLLVHFQRRFPQIQLQVEIAESEIIERRLRDGLLDIGLAPFTTASPDLRAVTFMHEEFVAVASRTLALSKQRKVTARQLEESFIARQLPSATGSLVLGYFARHKVQVRPLLSLGSIEAVKQAAIAGLGATIVSKTAVAADLSSKRLVELKVQGLPLRRPLYQIQPSSSQSKAAIAFACLLKHAVRGTLPTLKGILS